MAGSQILPTYEQQSQTSMILQSRDSQIQCHERSSDVPWKMIQFHLQEVLVLRHSSVPVTIELVDNRTINRGSSHKNKHMGICDCNALYTLTV